MTRNTSDPDANRDVSTILPGIVGGISFVFFLGTLNHWASLNSLPWLARVLGWPQAPGAPLSWTTLPFLPFRWLPDTITLWVLNGLTAACAALVLALLAKCAMLWPPPPPILPRVSRESVGRTPAADATAPTAPDKPGSPNPWANLGLSREEESRRRAWWSRVTAILPPLLAVLSLGLQLSFWEHATTATGQMPDLLLFGGVVACLLQFRRSRKQVWLSRAAFGYGACMAGLWVYLGLWPVFVGAVLGLKRLRFFRGRFLGRMALWGAAGFSLVLLPAVVRSLPDFGPASFWAALKGGLRFQWTALLEMPKPAILLLVLGYLLPLLVIGLKLRPSLGLAGEDNALGARITRSMVHVWYGTFLLIGLWLALEGPCSPRRLAPGAPLLGFSFLEALVMAYAARYFLSLLEPLAARPLPRVFAWAGASTLVLLTAALGLALLTRGFAQLRLTNGPVLRDLARHLYDALPPGPSVVLADQAAPLWLLRAELLTRGREKQPLPLDTQALPWTRYQQAMAKDFPQRWPEPPPASSVILSAEALVDLLTRFAAREPVVYLHPSFGYYFETFREQPAGLVHFLTPRIPGAKTDSFPPEAAPARNEAFWRELWTNRLAGLAGQIRRESRLALPPNASVLRRLRPRAEPNRTVLFLGIIYSRALNNWGVCLQRQGRWTEAADWFQHALQLKPDNFAAQLNLAFNQERQRTGSAATNAPTFAREYSDIAQRYWGWDQLRRINGPLDEPTALLATGRLLLAGHNQRQAAEAFGRCLELRPRWSEAMVGLATCRIASRDFSGAVSLLDEVLAAQPRDVDSLAAKGVAELELTHYETALTCLTDALALAPSNQVLRLNRAIAGLQAGRLATAEADYQELARTLPNSPQISFGLGEVAWRRHDTNAALNFFRQYLAQAPTNSLEYRLVSNRVATLTRPGSP